MKKIWIPLAVLALALPLLLGAQTQFDQQTAQSSNDRVVAAGDANRFNSPPNQNRAHPVVGAPSMELGVGHARSSDSDEIDYEQIYESRLQAADQELAAEERARAAKEAKHNAYVDEMREEYPGWYY